MMHDHWLTKREHLNIRLIEKQKLTDEDIDKVVDLHRELHEVFDEMEAETEDFDRLRKLTLVVKQLEFDLQEAWGFDKDETCHSWWFRVPHCKCPTMDNEDRVGTPYRVTTGSCPLHGDVTNEK